ncbi:MAG: B12-binding domain-containing radical SAM protein [Lachnospiraceae bacterium]|nr:B12-binding domain-containing radical SAM protein [Lachnospiraceae bacterium]
MRFLLVALNAKYIHSNSALYSLKRYAGENAVHVETAEYTINNRMEDILADIYGRRPDAVGFSCYIWNWSMIQDIITELHKLLPAIPVWLGGPEVSFDAEKILEQYPQITGIMAGEGEETFSELLEYYVNHDRALTEIDGLVLREGATKERRPLSMTEIPFLYDSLEDFANRIIYYESQRGCPYRCSYCLSSIDKTVRLRDINVVKKELQFFLDNRVEQVKFVDRTFNCNHQHAMAVWQYIHEHDNGVTNFHFEIAGDIINEEETELLNRMRPGLVQLEIGVQSTNEATLKEIRRVMDIDKLKAVTAAIKKGGNIHQHLDLIAGLPFEDYESFSRSFDEVYSMEPNQLQLGFLKVLKGSYMHEMAEQYGIVYTEKPPYEVLYTRWLSYEDVRRLKKVEEMVELYYNSSQFTHTLPVLQKAFVSPFAMYEALADYYEKEGCFVQTPSRIYRYQVLLAFAEVCDKQKLPLYKELLTFDLYLRENAKSRPDFACDLAPYKNEITEFYRKEETERRFLPDYTAYDGRQLARMTHLEPFSYPVWEKADVCVAWKGQAGEPGKEGTTEAPDKADLQDVAGYVLFDYQNRSPLTHEAGVILIR